MIKGLIQIPDRRDQIRKCRLETCIVAMHTDALAAIHRLSGAQLPRFRIAPRLRK
jgi:hypothetical protein